MGTSVFSVNNKLIELKKLLSEMHSIVVAYSGGVDSTFLAKVATDTLGDRALVVTAKSPSLAEDELKLAMSIAKKNRMNHLVIETNELKNPNYKVNDLKRCYYCKQELYQDLIKIAEDRQLKYIVNGANVDDLGDYRPGMNAANDFGVRSPLIEVSLRKVDIRLLSRELSLPTFNKPAQPCLASRIPYGKEVSVDVLSQIEQAEKYIKNLGIDVVRVRHYGELARIEVEPINFPKLLNSTTKNSVTRYFKKLGFKDVSLDPEGYRTGSLNEGKIPSVG
ncbi:MAG: ATP-dependent sacrificial sulfur transferase LarE [SAR202 cluster bacterium]|nr:ATP-dependent sacrificial sulfur transferase LarE [SAR202 cluster bacterium]